MKVRELTNQQLDQIIELEVRNIVPVLNDLGFDENKESATNYIHKAMDKEVIYVQLNDIIQGFCIYTLDNDVLLIRTFNLLKFNNKNVLTSMFKEIIMLLNENSITIIKSSAHINNKRSINFHARLGFKQISKDKHSIEYEVKKAIFLHHIQHRIERLITL